MDRVVEELVRRAAADPNVIGLGGGLPSVAQFPRRAMALAFIRAVQQPVADALQYGWPEGVPSLRQRIADRLRERGAEVDADDVIVTNGAQQAIAIATELVGRRGDVIATDAETYPAALDLFRARGLATVPLTSAPRRLAAAYVMPALANPRGSVMTDDARAAVLALGRPIIEDDAYAELRFEGPPGRPLLADARDRVFHAGTFSKVLCPGLRVGWLVPPPRHRERAVALKHDADLQASSLGQAVVDEFFARQALEPWATRLRRFYRRRAWRLGRALTRALPEARFAAPSGGFALWLELDPDRSAGVDELDLLRAAIDEGVTFDLGSTFRPDAARTPLALRLCFSYVEAPALDEGARRLAAAFRRVVRGRSARRPTRRHGNVSMPNRTSPSRQ